MRFKAQPDGRPGWVVQISPFVQKLLGEDPSQMQGKAAVTIHHIVLCLLN